MTRPFPESIHILGMRVDATDYTEAIELIADWAAERRPRLVYAANVHMTMEAYDDPGFRRLVNDAELVTPDGTPLVWALRLLGKRSQQRVYGPDLTLHVCAMAARRGIPISLYGGTPNSLEAFACRLRELFPALQVVCQIAPPFRPLDAEQDSSVTSRFVESRARILLVGIGCPKQERWMAEHKDRIPSVMIGVGAAFDFHSGRVKQAPAWMQTIGMEWFFRLLMEPRRLWKRYLKHNPRFVFLFLLQLLRIRRFPQT